MKKNLLWLLGVSLGSALLFKAYSNAEIATEGPEGKYILLTGASTGIGKAIAELLAKNNFKVFATVRKQEDADKLSELSGNIIPLLMDVTDHESILQAKEKAEVMLGGKKLYSIINNAGIAVAGPIETLPVAELKKQFEVNLFGLVDTIQIFFNLLDINNAKIVNISSIGGRVGNPFLGAYAASKHALEGISDSFRRELLTTGIDIIVVQPGKINTPIWEKAEAIDTEPYKGTRYEKMVNKIRDIAITEGPAGETPENVALEVLGILKRKKNKSRYIISKKIVREVYIMRYLPDRILDKLVKRVLF